MISLNDRTIYDGDMISRAQIRAARALIGWRQADLAEASRVSEISIKNIESGKTDARGSTLSKIEDALKAGGVRFVDENGDGPGVRLRRLIWKLTPLNPESRNWQASTVCQEVIIRAATEDRARNIASMAFGIAVERKSPTEDTILNPWGRIVGEASCERITDSGYPEDDPDEILDPAEYDHEWRP